MPTPAENHVQQLESASRIEAYGRQFIFGIATIYLKTNRSRLVFFRPDSPVLARVRVALRRTRLPRTPPFRAVFRSLFAPILCVCEGRLRTPSSDNAAFRQLVRYGNCFTLATRVKKPRRGRGCVGALLLTAMCLQRRENSPRAVLCNRDGCCTAKPADVACR